jgi:23S rRNA pseudouridine1911/1915/1917 synthase
MCSLPLSALFSWPVGNRPHIHVISGVKTQAKTLVVARSEGGQSVAAILRARLHLSWSEARRLVAENRVRLSHGLCRNPEQRLKAGQHLIVHLKPDPKKQPARDENRKKGERPAAGPWSRYRGPKPLVRHVDDQVVVVDKPAGLTTMRHAEEAAEFGKRGQRFLPPTLAELLPELLPPVRSGKRPRVRAVHRLDRDTSGLVVFALTPAAESHLGRQFRAHTVGRRYLAVVRGQAKAERIESDFVANRGDARRGSSAVPGQGNRAITNVTVAEALGDFTLVECRLETGRTHQVRIHLGERGTPICGERVYDRPVHGAPLPDTSGSPRLALHAADLEFEHPATGKRLSFHAPLPADMRELLKRLRKPPASRPAEPEAR